MALNGISTMPSKAARKAAKLALAKSERIVPPPTVVSGSTTWEFQVYVPTTFNPPATVTEWKIATTYALNTYVHVPSTGWYYKCIAAGTTGTSEPIWPNHFASRPLHDLMPNPQQLPLVTGRPWQL